MKGRVLLVDDDGNTCEVLAERLELRGFVVCTENSAEAALDRLSRESFDVVVTDINMRGMSGIELCERVATNRPDVPVILITAFGSLESAVAAIRVGAYDFVTKPFEIESLALSLHRAVQTHSLREEVKQLRKAVTASHQFEDLLGASPAMAQVYSLIERVADSDASVLITGESGTGKELVARALHNRGKRRAGPFVALNCSAVPESLMESELFGHAKGAFTDARQARTGLLKQADAGTLFLDEIGDMSLSVQPKLLRALQERCVRPVGASAEISFDARVVAATHRDLESVVEDRTFREDLYYRLNVIHIHLPPLRSRGGDVLVLAQHFISIFAARSGKKVQGLAPQAAERLLAYAWPGNVRELQNCIERAVALTRFEELAVEDLPEKIRSYRSRHVLVAGDDPSELVPLDEVERRYILRVLDTVAGNKTAAAKILGIERATLYRKLERYAQGTASE
ncbi:MAG: sigma-54 dependent transcriptional regulator [Deltaproteobacteria bacterium]|nr:sigma-54 dependent transcriptional regulator [Deltaproteobacteria bacterium]